MHTEGDRAAMDEQELRELQDEEAWDSDRAERRPGNKQARAVVSVAFSRQDFERVSECARLVGRRLSEFIREAALERAAEHGGRSAMTSYSASYGSTFFTERQPQSTRTTGRVVRAPEPAATG